MKFACAAAERRSTRLSIEEGQNDQNGDKDEHHNLETFFSQRRGENSNTPEGL
ncbi:MAG: hypothetical protein ABJM26_20900 [Anderseniella sp.]